jgi:hypothetical protein
MSAVKERVATTVRERATRSGKPPRRAYQHYFIEAEGLHSRIHLQNFYSTFWPEVDAPATAHIHVYDADGQAIGTTEREIARFGCAFIEARDLLAELGSDARQGTVAIDLEPSGEVRKHFDELPAPDVVEVRTPFWMAYYDDGENYMYVHSIEMLEGQIFGTTKPVEWHVNRGTAAAADAGAWRSWRLLESAGLDELQVVAINHRAAPGATTVGVYTAGGGAVAERRLEFEPRQLHRVRFTREEIAEGLERLGGPALLRVGLDPLLTNNGKPYVLMRYDNGPLSLHHG